MKWHEKHPDKYEHIFGKYYVRKGYFGVCSILGLLVGLALLVVGCASLGDIGSFTIGESTISTLLENWLEAGIRLKYTIRW